ncbi:MAG: 4Fe-4S binding protein [Chloroflexi bacterium]|nr:4Fe-4S binding protein [Chloroflexota bacterium]
MELALPEVDDGKCEGCGDCVRLCPGHAVALIAGKAVIVLPENCDYCADCEAFCPSSAIRCPFEIVMGDGAGEDS